MRLRTVSKGVYSTHKADYSNPHQLILAAHPFYLPDSGLELISPGYVERIKWLYRTHKGPIVTLEDYRYTRSTAKRLSGPHHSPHRYFIKTKRDDPEPIEIDESGVPDFLRKFPKGPIGLVGGFFDGVRENAGCLGHVAWRLSDIDGFGIDVMYGMIFGSEPAHLRD